ELRDAMDLAYLNGQRPAGVLKMRFTEIRNGSLEVQQNKTKKKLRILLEGDSIRTEVGKMMDRSRAGKRGVVGFSLVSTS
ncbi:integrase, partial [Xylella fastidiosa subsp. multiplex]|nr:integrase [Xylella fastidiosa subsp. multiplex]